MTTLYGMQVLQSIYATKTVVRERRVRGGYLNRWLIRAFVEEQVPAAFVMGKTFVLHPTIYQTLMEELYYQSLRNMMLYLPDPSAPGYGNALANIW